MIIKIYKFFQRFWEILYLPISLLYYLVRDAQEEGKRIGNMIKDARKNWKEID